MLVMKIYILNVLPLISNLFLRSIDVAKVSMHAKESPRAKGSIRAKVSNYTKVTPC